MLQLRACNQEERAFFDEGYGSGAKVTVCLTEVRRYLVTLLPANSVIISTANAAIKVLQFVSISQPSLYHL